MLVREKFNPNDYDFYVKEYIRKSEERDKPISHSELRKDPYNLPDARWYIKHCPDKKVVKWSDFIDWCGFISYKKKPSKEKLTKMIYDMQEKYNRPLMYDDFRGHGCYRIPIALIREYWGSVNKMKEDLGLEIVQESMLDKQLSKEGFDNMIADICDYVSKDKRDFITTKEINNNKNWQNYWTLCKIAQKYYDCSLHELFESYGISFGKQGNGILYDFEDGEHTTSQFEYMFSKFLRNYGLKYNVDYFRDVRYNTFIDKCNDCSNCDYVIHIDDRIIYIEIAGIIEEYKSWYYQNKSIDRSKSKEKYRIKLQKKETMLKENGLIYFILFPCDLTEDNMLAILEDGSLELRKSIEQFKQNNIDWVKIRENGGKLDYSKPFLRDTRPKQKEVV